MPPAPTPRSRDLLGFGLALVGVAIFGGTLPMTRIAVTVYSPWFVTVGRAAIAAVLAGLLLTVLRRRFPVRAAWPSLAVAAVTTVIGFPIFSAIAMRTVPASHGGVVLGLLPLATSIAAVVVNGEQPSARFWLWSALGAALVVGFAMRTADPSFGFGDVWLVVAGASASTGYAHYARLSRWMPGWEAISWALVVMAPLTVPAALLAWRPDFAAASPAVVASLAYVGVLSVFIGFFFWNAGLAIGGVARVGQVQLLQTFFTLAISAVANRETIDPQTLAFAVAVMAVVLLARRSAVGRRKNPGTG